MKNVLFSFEQKTAAVYSSFLFSLYEYSLTIKYDFNYENSKTKDEFFSDHEYECWLPGHSV